MRGQKPAFSPVKSMNAICIGGLHRLRLLEPLLPFADEPSASATFFFVLPVQNDGMPHSSASCNTGFRPVAIIRNDFYFVFFQQLFCSYHSRVEAQNTFGFERQAAVEETVFFPLLRLPE